MCGSTRIKRNNNGKNVLDEGRTNLPKEIVETWKPVYKETKTLPEINGYKGEITQISGIVKYGCAQLSSKGIKAFLENKSIGINREINSVTLDSGVEITIEQLQQIVDYFKD